MKKLSCFLLSLVIILSAIPLTALAKAEYIREVYVNFVPTPVDGRKWQGYQVTVPENASYSIHGQVEWYDETENRTMKNNETFQLGHIYTVRVRLQPKDGYEFDATATEYNMKGYIGSRGKYPEATLSKDFDYQRWAMVVVSYTFPETEKLKEITQISVSDVKEPKIGRQSIAREQYLKYSDNIEGYEAFWLENYDWDNHFTGVFAEEKRYTFVVDIAPKEGYCFAADKDSIVATINGTVAEVRLYGDGTIRLLYDFKTGKAPEKVMGIVTFDIDAPAIGANPSFEPKDNREDGLYYLDKQHKSSTKNGVVWYEGVGNNERKMTENDTFKANENYYVAIRVRPAQGYEFDTDENGDLLVRGAINGNTAIASGNEEAMFVGYAFRPLDEPTEQPEEQPDVPVITIENKFSDVASDDWFYNDVMLAVQLGLINGKTETGYKPNDNLTYAEAIKLAACMNQLYTTGKVILTNGSPWYQSYVDYCTENGIIDKEYDYNDYATRAGYMTIFANALPDQALKAINDVPDNSIPDVSMNESYSASIYKLYRAGILQGSDAEHNCKPLESIRRSEVATILSRMMYAAKRVSITDMAE